MLQMEGSNVNEPRGRRLCTVVGEPLFFILGRLDALRAYRE